ncbi:sulfurtransferase [Sulfobacillus harzensis]|uniref:Sulfurtransferase n=1 Tax=Sulfobacillus harzensis TaxID=2729629 RepID=A0A7Y0L0M1_9FIRM|nr:sulfurtransferase [Sulfobacillus harzensis]NMP21098.1 sulfurtransferase [Sulfobacillus harzensis]
MQPQFGPLIEPEWLHDHLADPRLVILDCRWRLQQPDYGDDAFRAGHIPGAVFIDLHRQLAGPPGPPGGRHPLPSQAAFSEVMAQAGVREGSWVVAYDDDGAGAARCWWLLTFFGHSQVAVLNGGFAAWERRGGPVTTAVTRPTPGAFTPRPNPAITIDFETLWPNYEAMTLVDARAPERYRGEVEPMDRVAGHIPGAINQPYQQLLAEDGRFKSPVELQQLLEPVLSRTDRPVVYCGSGVSACVDILGLTLIGAQPILYPGSWSGWIEHPVAPIARG